MEKENRVPGVRFCPEVEESECRKCKLGPYGHPLVKSVDTRYDGEVYNKLCIKDCLKFKLVKYSKGDNSYNLINEDCIQLVVVEKHCPDCKIAYTGHHKGEYSPRLKAVYERSGANGLFIKIAYRCPNCKKFFDLSCFIFL